MPGIQQVLTKCWEGEASGAPLGVDWTGHAGTAVHDDTVTGPCPSRCRHLSGHRAGEKHLLKPELADGKRHGHKQGVQGTAGGLLWVPHTGHQMRVEFRRNPDFSGSDQR